MIEDIFIENASFLLLEVVVRLSVDRQRRLSVVVVHWKGGHGKLTMFCYPTMVLSDVGGGVVVVGWVGVYKRGGLRSEGYFRMKWGKIDSGGEKR